MNKIIEKVGKVAIALTFVTTLLTQSSYIIGNIEAQTSKISDELTPLNLISSGDFNKTNTVWKLNNGTIAVSYTHLTLPTN